MPIDFKPEPPPAPDKTCAITIHNVLGWDLDPEMLAAVLGRLTLTVQEAKVIDVYPQERVPTDAPAWKHPGYCEWLLRIHYRSGSTLTIGAISRSPGADVEFHS